MTTEVHDPYGGCEDTCTHDLARTATAKELREGDGPYPAEHPLFPRRWLADMIVAANTRQASASRLEP